MERGMRKEVANLKTKKSVNKHKKTHSSSQLSVGCKLKQENCCFSFYQISQKKIQPGDTEYWNAVNGEEQTDICN